jgi:hypothetical protein
MKNKIFIIFILTFFAESISSQSTKNSSDWEVRNYSGSCYHDTIIHAIWIKLIPNEKAKYYKNDTTFLVIEAEVVNKSPIPIYFRGKNDRMLAFAQKETSIIDTVLFKKKPQIHLGMPPTKFHQESARIYYGDRIMPFRDLWDREKKLFIEILPNERKRVYIPFPKHEASYIVEAIVEFNKEGYAYDCEGQKVEWPNFRTIQSNKIDLIKK